jgi:lysine-specific demethylase 8
MSAHFQVLAPARFQGMHALRSRTEPSVFRGLASHWPAVQNWRFSRLAELVPDMPVKLVAGNRERGGTQFISSTLRSYLALLASHNSDADPAGQSLYLKEFDLLDAVPQLRTDLKHAELLPADVTSSLRSWIGPAGARTGLHYDYLDNTAVQIVGTKRFYLVRPGTAERLNAVARKYDSWAVLSTRTAHELVSVAGTTGDFFVADLEPGDVLHVPAGWWHEVLNVTPSLLFGGFHGSRATVLTRWGWVQICDLLHRIGLIGYGNCTCHPGR